MDTEALLKGYQDVVEANRTFVGLLDNPDFQAWRRDVVERRLAAMRDAVLTVDRTQPGWKERAADLVTAYQEAQALYRSLFTLVEETVREARQQMARIQKEQGRS